MQAIIYPAEKKGTVSSHSSLMWHLRFIDQEASFTENLMGWTGSNNMQKELHLTFKDLQSAITYAKENNIDVDIIKQATHKVTTRSYTDNYKYKPYEE